VIILEAIAEYVARHRTPEANSAFGLWGTGAEDGLTDQARQRAEW
jgi:hypothetical protein